MNEENVRRLRELLQNNLPPEGTGLGRDLWPEMLRRMDRSTVTVHWLDWVLLGLLAGLLSMVPEAIPVFLYHF